MRIPAQLRTSHLLTACQYENGECVLVEGDHGQRNPDDDRTFGDHVYVIYRHVEAGLPADAYTEPFASCTSMAMARTLVHKEGLASCTIERAPRDSMPPAAAHRITVRDAMFAAPAMQQMLRKRGERAAIRARQRAARLARQSRHATPTAA
jgi:hypothetical protein